MKRVLRIIALLAALAMISVACSSGDSDNGGDGGGASTTAANIADAQTADAPDETGLKIDRGGEVSIGIVAESTGWYPPSAETAFSAGFLVMDALYDRWFHQTGTGELIPMLAEERATPNADATEWTMKIREGIQFHDGTDLNAQAAVDMIDQWSEGPFASNSTIDRAEVVDEYTVRYFLKDADPAFEDSLSGISTGAAFSPTAGRAYGPEDSVENPVGTGPFMFESWTRDSEMVVVRNPNYWRSAPDGGTLPYLDRIRFRVLSDADARRASFEAGDLELTTQGGPLGAQDLIDQGATAYEYIGNGAGINIYNTLVPPFDDVRLRRAAAHALDPANAAALRPANLSGVNVVRTQYFSTESRWYDEEAGADYALFDLAEAERLIAEYVNDPTRSDGKAVGEPVSFTYECNTDPINLDTAQLYQQEWGDVGFEVDIDTTEQASFITKIVGTTSEPLFAGEFQIACWADGSEQDPLQIFRTRYVEGQVLNWTNFHSFEVDAQIDLLRNTLDFETRRAATAEITRITAQEMPTYWWASGSTLVLTSSDVHGLETYSFPDGGGNDRMSDGRVWWYEVWLEGAEPLSDIPTGFVDIPDVPVTTPPTTAPPAAAVPINGDVEAAMPESDVLALGNTDPPLADVCTDISFLEDIVPVSATHQRYNGVPTFGPFAAINVYELGEGEADAIMGRYALAAVDCVEFSSVLNGQQLKLGYVVRDLGSWGDASASYGIVGTADGFAIDTSAILIKTGNNLAVVTTLHVLADADETILPFADAAEGILAGL
ncbi:MAG: ABC transporter substrate-binding protein [Acidimicrobiales bacterium]|jgi:peptide/nickel transport system substrate-binding protein